MLVCLETCFIGGHFPIWALGKAGGKEARIIVMTQEIITGWKHSLLESETSDWLSVDSQFSVFLCSTHSDRLHHYATVLTISFVCHMENLNSLSLPPALYPNLEELGDYMGLSLNSDEVQRNLALVPVASNVSG